MAFMVNLGEFNLLLEQFEQRKQNVKLELNSIVDGLFGQFVNDFNCLVKPVTDSNRTRFCESLRKQRNSSTHVPQTANALLNNFNVVPTTRHSPVYIKQELSEEDEEELEYSSSDLVQYRNTTNQVISHHSQTLPSTSSSQHLGSALNNHLSFIIPSTFHEHTHSDSECDCPECVPVNCVLKESPEDQEDDEENEHHIQDLPNRQGTNRLFANGIFVNKDLISSPSTAENVEESVLVTLGMKCPLEECNTFVKSKGQLERHLFDSHRIFPYRCLRKGCSRSFKNNVAFGIHVRDDHKGHSRWPCAKCSKDFTSHTSLSQHMNVYHFTGQFKCAKKRCDFASSTRIEVYLHNRMQHRRFACQYRGCGKTFPSNYKLIRHQQIHFRLKPFRCKWPQCRFASDHQAAVISHVRVKHFNLPSSIRKQRELNIEDERDAKHFVGTVSKLVGCANGDLEYKQI